MGCTQSTVNNASITHANDIPLIKANEPIKSRNNANLTQSERSMTYETHATQQLLEVPTAKMQVAYQEQAKQSNSLKAEDFDEMPLRSNSPLFIDVKAKTSTAQQNIPINRVAVTQPLKNALQLRKMKVNWNQCRRWQTIAKYLQRAEIFRTAGLSKEIHLELFGNAILQNVQKKRVPQNQSLLQQTQKIQQKQRSNLQEGTQNEEHSGEIVEEYYVEEEGEEEQFEEIDLQEETRNQNLNANTDEDELNQQLPPRRSSMMNQTPSERNDLITEEDISLKKAQTQFRRLQSIKETIREQQSEMDSVDKKDRQDNVSFNQGTLEQVVETESKLFTETDGNSIQNSLPNERTSANFEGISSPLDAAKISPTLKNKAPKSGDANSDVTRQPVSGVADHRYQQSLQAPEESSSLGGSNQIMKTLPSHHENPMMSIKSMNFGDDFGKATPFNVKNARTTDPNSFKKINLSKTRVESNSDQTEEAQNHAHSSVQVKSMQNHFERSESKTTSDQTQKLLEQKKAPRMQLKETISYNAAEPAPMIRIFEEINSPNEKQTDIVQPMKLSKIPLHQKKTSQSSVKSGPPPLAEVGGHSPKVAITKQLYPNEFPKTVNKHGKLETSVENDQEAKDKAYLQFKEIYERRLQQQQKLTQAAKPDNEIKEQTLGTSTVQDEQPKNIETQHLKFFPNAVHKETPQWPNSMSEASFQKVVEESREYQKQFNQVKQQVTVGTQVEADISKQDDSENQSPQSNSVPQKSALKPHQRQGGSPITKNVKFQDQQVETTSFPIEKQEQKLDIEQFKPYRVELQKSTVQEDPSGTYTQEREDQDLRELVLQREIAKIRMNYNKSETEKMPLLRMEMRKKNLQKKLLNSQIPYIQKQQNTTEFSRNTLGSLKKSQKSATQQVEEENDSQSYQSTFNETEKRKSTSNLLESLSRQMMAQAHQDPQQFKSNFICSQYFVLGMLLKFLCEGYVEEVKKLFQYAPHQDSRFRDCQQFYFAMFHSHLDKAKENKLISPIAVAVNVGIPELLDILLQNLENINIEFGIERKRNPTSLVLKQNQQLTVRKKSPLQFACSLGLYRMVEMLLQAGADPNGVPNSERIAQIDYDMNPLVICMNKKYHGDSLEIDGLTFKQRIDPSDVDYEMCMRHLLRYKTNTNAEILGKKRKSRPIFHAIREPYSTLKLLLDFTADKDFVVNQQNAFGETPLCIVASLPNDQDQKAKLLLDCGASCFASDVLNPLTLAIENKNYKIMRLLYRQGDANPNRGNDEGSSPLQVAIVQNNHQLVRELIHWKELQSSLSHLLDQSDGQGRNIMHIIAMNKGIEVFKSLMSETKNRYLNEIKQALNSPEGQSSWLTPLAYCYPSIEMSRLFVRYGADPNILSFLHCFFKQAGGNFNNKSSEATSEGVTLNTEYLKFLVNELGLNPNETDETGKDAIAYCYEANMKIYIAFLVSELGADLDLPTMPQGRTVLLDAAFRGYVELFEFFLSKGANPECRDSLGKSLQEYIKCDYGEPILNLYRYNQPGFKPQKEALSLQKTQMIKDQMQKILYKYTLSKPIKVIAKEKKAIEMIARTQSSTMMVPQQQSNWSSMIGTQRI